MEELIELLREVRDDVDFEGIQTLIDDSVLDSFDILQIINLIDEKYDISIPAVEVVADNFNSAEAMLRMINRLKGTEG